MRQHSCHKAHIPKVNRINGQLNAIVKMIEGERYCMDILQQLKAVQGAVERVQNDVLETHLNHCVSKAMSSRNKEEKDQKIQELLKFFRKK